MRILRELSLYWVPIIVAIVSLGVCAHFGIRFAKEFNRQHGLKVAERDDAIMRTVRFCKNATIVEETNYGAKCREYLVMSQSTPLWEALAGTADTYYGFCNARNGCGIGVTVMLMAMASMGTALFMLLRYSYTYRERVRDWTDNYDRTFMLDGCGTVQQSVHHMHDNSIGHVPHAPVGLSRGKCITICSKDD